MLNLLGFNSIKSKPLKDLGLNQRLNCAKKPASITFKGSRPMNDVVDWYSQVIEEQLSPNKDNLKILPDILHQLFKALPKTDLHLHLAGSAPLPLIKQIMLKNGLSPEEVEEKTTIKKNFENLDDFSTTYSRLSSAIKTPEQFKQAAYEICKDAAKENVKYLEIRTGLLHKDGTPDQLLRAVTEGIKQAEEELKPQGISQIAKIIVLAKRHDPPNESLQQAQIAVAAAKEPGSLVVGFDIAGQEIGFPAKMHAEAIKYAKAGGLKVTIHASEKLPPGDLTPAEAIKSALDLDTDRIGHGVFVLDDPVVLKEVVNKQIPVESPPKSNVQVNEVDSYKAHPIKKMLDAGVKVSVSTDNRTISSTNITNEFAQLYLHNIITSWNDIKKLTMNGADSVFLPQNERQELVKNFETELKAIESQPKFKNAIDKYLTPAISFLGKKYTEIFSNKVA